MAHKIIIENDLNLNTSGGSNSLLSITVVKDHFKFEEIYNNYEEINNDFFEEFKSNPMNFNTVNNKKKKRKSNKNKNKPQQNKTI